ncbi:hypothetical protein J2S00_003886 [Caldalkalibacillus uzonensis]|uniref:Holin-like toxin n=1 Tax=Caldalkalibacillus uzonensis TaxID=353224 RepID=A0ABU0CY13_9BACI|nr:hypothetical protein [Caldalkalibacillus uzonensis]
MDILGLLTLLFTGGLFLVALLQLVIQIIKTTRK